MNPAALSRLRDELAADSHTLHCLAEAIEHECKQGRHIDLVIMRGHIGLIGYIAERLELAAENISRAEKVAL